MYGGGGGWIYIYIERKRSWDLTAPDFAVMMYIYIYIYTYLHSWNLYENTPYVSATGFAYIYIYIYIYIRTYTLYIICVEAQNMYDSLLVPDTHSGSSKGRCSCAAAQTKRLDPWHNVFLGLTTVSRGAAGWFFHCMALRTHASRQMINICIYIYTNVNIYIYIDHQLLYIQTTPQEP